MKWALSWLQSPTDQHALLRFGHSTPLELSINDSVVYRGQGDGVGLADSFAVKVPLNAGWNQLAVHFTGVPDVKPTFSLRFADAQSRIPGSTCTVREPSSPLDSCRESDGKPTAGVGLSRFARMSNRRISTEFRRGVRN